jgi:hypothetical protein
MLPEELAFLLSPGGRAALDDLAATTVSPDSHLALVERLRARYGPGKAAALVETLRLRQKAIDKFSRGREMFLTAGGLEQATHEIVAAHRARRYVAAGISLVSDLGCGIGGDAIALALAGLTVIAVDREWLRVKLAQANAAVYDVAPRLLPFQADLTEIAPLPVDAFFFDPARRTPTGSRLPPSRRLRSTSDYQPPLSLIDTWRPVAPHGAVKVSPGIAYEELPPEAEVEFVSLAGELKEAALWYGELRTGARRRATLLPGGHTLTDEEEGEVEAGPPRAYLYEPDGAVIRAHLVGQLGRRLNATLLDPQIAYLTAGEPAPTPLARCYRIEDHFPFQLKRLRSYLRERDVGRVTIKKRGSPLDPDILRQALRLRGTTHRVIFLTQVMGRPMVLIGQAHTDT